MSRFTQALYEQIAGEFAASQQYAVDLAREEGDHVGEQFLGWFLAEQREEVASASALLAVLDRAGVDNLLLVEAYLAQASVAAAEPTGAAPSAAGGAL